VLVEDPRAQWRGALALVLTAIIAAATTRVVARAGLSSMLLPSVPAGVQGVTRRGCCRGGHVPGPRWLFHHRALAGG
jgi:hypothetical protein